MNLDEPSGQVDLDGAIDVVLALAATHRQQTGRSLACLVLIGGTALAAHEIRTLSDDVDLYASEIDDALIDQVTKTFAARFGPRFKIDATPSNTLWGAIALADIESSPIVRTAGDVAIRALSIETLYLVKVAADREKDRPDSQALAKETTYEKAIERARQLFPWYADRSTFPEHAERLARYMSRDFGRPLSQVDHDFGLPMQTAEKVSTIRTGLEAQFMLVLRGLMQRRPELIAYTTKNPRVLIFDAKAAGATDEVLALVKTKPSDVSDLAAIALKTRDPRRHAKRLLAIKNLRNSPER